MSNTLLPEHLHLKNRVVDLCQHLVKTDVDELPLQEDWLDEMMTTLTRIKQLKDRDFLEKIVRRPQKEY